MHEVGDNVRLSFPIWVTRPQTVPEDPFPADLQIADDT